MIKRLSALMLAVLTISCAAALTACKTGRAQKPTEEEHPALEFTLMSEVRAEKSIDQDFLSDDSVPDSAYLCTVTANAEGDVTVPGEYMGSPVAAVHLNQFSQNKNYITSLTVSEGVRFLFDVYTNYHDIDSLESLTLPKSLEEIDDSFHCCHALKSVTLPGGLKRVVSSFIRCDSLEQVDVDSEILEMRNSFSESKALDKVSFSGQRIDFDLSFNMDYALTELSFPESLTIGMIDSSFEDCTSLVKVVFGGAVGTVNDSFDSCPELTAVDFPGGIDIIDASFDDCGKLTGAMAERLTEDERQKDEERRRRLKEQYADEPYGPGTSSLYLKADDSRYACYRLFRMDGDMQFQVLLAPGESTTESFPSGRYTLKAAEGEKWISDEEAFGSAGKYSSTNVFTFEAGKKYQITSGSQGDFHSDSAKGFAV